MFKLLGQIKEAEVFQKSRSHSIVIGARSKFRFSNVRRQRKKFSRLGDLAPMLFIPLWQIKEYSRSNLDFLKGIISTVSTVGITCLGLLKKKKQVRHWGFVGNEEELLSTSSNMSARASWLGSGLVFSVGWIPVLCYRGVFRSRGRELTRKASGADQ